MKKVKCSNYKIATIEEAKARGWCQFCRNKCDKTK